MKDIENFSVLHHLGLSDHECLSVSIKTNGFHVIEVQKVKVVKNDVIVYNNKTDFLRKLRSPLGREKVARFLEKYLKCNETSIEPMYSDLVNILTSFSVNIDSSNRKAKRKNNKRKKKDKRPWYTNECRKIKGVRNRAEKDYKKEPFNHNKKELLFTARKKIVRKFVEILKISLDTN